jgi:hypothetical protein
MVSAESSKFDFVSVFGSENREIAEEVKNLWRENNILPETEMNERVKELAIIAKHFDGRLAGVTTVRKTQVPLLNDNYFFEFRCFIAPAFRQPALDTQLVVKTKQLLETVISVDKPAIGLIMVVENPVLKRWTKAVWAGADFYFAGFTTKGHHLRVSYFKNAMI